MYFYATGEKAGQEKLGKWARILGFAQESGVDLPGEAAGLIPGPEWKRSRAFSARRKLSRLQTEMEYTVEEIEHIERLVEDEEAPGSEGDSGHLEKLKARARQLRKDISREKWRAALFERERAWVPGDTRNMAIGQGDVLVTPLQMARFVGAIANGGKLLRPHVSARPGEDYVERKLPVSRGTLDVMRRAMREVVFGKRGTARQEALRAHDVAAKTGTAEIGGELNNGWIVGFAPYDAPRVSFAVVVERTELHGGEVAGPLVAEILDAYFGE